MGFRIEDVREIVGAPMVDRDGVRIGTIEDVFLDRHTGHPAWAAVKTGLFGRRQTPVPIVDAFFNPNADVVVPFTKEQVKEAPQIEPGQELAAELERELWEHYGLTGYEQWSGEDRTRALGLPDEADDLAARDAAPVPPRLRRVVIVAVSPFTEE